jgi:beta-aspartyl-dipeptidase (metallo-type)
VKETIRFVSAHLFRREEDPMNSSAPITILRNARVYSPTPLGVCDLVVADGRVSSIGAELPSLPSGIPHDEIDLGGRSLVPGFIDSHVHLTGGGGESGPGSRVPPLAFSELTRAGVTTCVGVLGTDGTTRTIRDLVASALAMTDHGLSAYCYTGSYAYPVTTLTGSIRDDIVFIGPVLGVGELAVSDHRSSQMTLDEFLRVASDSYTAGLMSGKAGVLHLHMGDGPRQFQLIEQALEQAEIPARVYHPTHVNRQKALFEAAIGLSRRGVTGRRGDRPLADWKSPKRAADMQLRWRRLSPDIRQRRRTSTYGSRPIECPRRDAS